MDARGLAMPLLPGDGDRHGGRAEAPPSSATTSLPDSSGSSNNTSASYYAMFMKAVHAGGLHGGIFHEEAPLALLQCMERAAHECLALVDEALVRKGFSGRAYEDALGRALDTFNHWTDAMLSEETQRIVDAHPQIDTVLFRAVCTTYVRHVHGDVLRASGQRASIRVPPFGNFVRAFFRHLAADAYVRSAAYFDRARLAERKLVHADAVRAALDLCMRGNVTYVAAPPPSPSSVSSPSTSASSLSPSSSSVSPSSSTSSASVVSTPSSLSFESPAPKMTSTPSSSSSSTSSSSTSSSSSVSSTPTVPSTAATAVSVPMASPGGSAATSAQPAGMATTQRTMGQHALPKSSLPIQHHSEANRANPAGANAPTERAPRLHQFIGSSGANGGDAASEFDRHVGGPLPDRQTRGASPMRMASVDHNVRRMSLVGRATTGTGGDDAFGARRPSGILAGWQQGRAMIPFEASADESDGYDHTVDASSPSPCVPHQASAGHAHDFAHAANRNMLGPLHANRAVRLAGAPLDMHIRSASNHGYSNSGDNAADPIDRDDRDNDDGGSDGDDRYDGGDGDDNTENRGNVTHGGDAGRLGKNARWNAQDASRRPARQAPFVGDVATAGAPWGVGAAAHREALDHAERMPPQQAPWANARRPHAMPPASGTRRPHARPLIRLVDEPAMPKFVQGGHPNDATNPHIDSRDSGNGWGAPGQRIAAHANAMGNLFNREYARHGDQSNGADEEEDQDGVAGQDDNADDNQWTE